MRYTVSIKENYLLKKILKKGFFYKGKAIVIYILPNNSITNNIAVCVNKRNGNSVVRNKFKRWVREVYKEEENGIKKGFSIVFLYRKNITKEYVDYYVIKEDIKKGFEDLKIYEQRN